MTAMSVLSLNLRHGGGRRTEAIAEYVADSSPDIFVATEFRSGAAGIQLLSRLTGAGYHQAFFPSAPKTTNCVMVANRLPAEALSFRPSPGDAHRIVGCRVAGISVVGVYFANGGAKASLFGYLLTRPPEIQRNALLVGDFNTGLHPLDDSGVRLRCADLFAALDADVLVDAWRGRNGYEAREFSWMSRSGNSFRLDHAFATRDLATRITRCCYDHGPRTTGLSDHSAIWVGVDRAVTGCIR